MTKRQNIFMEIFSILFFSISLLLVSSNQTFAAERQKTFLQVSPSTQQLGGLQPGETREGSFKVQNVGSGAFDFKVYASSYEVKSENYDPIFDGEKDGSKIASWFTFSQTTGHLESDTEVTIHYKIKVPANAPGGGQYGAIMVETEKDKIRKVAGFYSGGGYGVPSKIFSKIPPNSFVINKGEGIDLKGASECQKFAQSIADRALKALGVEVCDNEKY